MRYSLPLVLVTSATLLVIAAIAAPQAGPVLMTVRLVLPLVAVYLAVLIAGRRGQRHGRACAVGMPMAISDLVPGERFQVLSATLVETAIFMVVRPKFLEPDSDGPMLLKIEKADPGLLNTTTVTVVWGLDEVTLDFQGRETTETATAT